MTLSENVRLVIWDLDETFWRGTLTEGGVAEHVSDNEEIVRQLALRGIVSSICSKNDYETVKQILIRRGIWDYFIFPSIEWTSKGQRVNDIVEAVQLRASTVLFIDDNPQNLAEARDRCPDIQTVSHEIIETLLSQPEMQGKSDSEMTRLKQYKILESKQTDFVKAKRDGVDDRFLRSCGIKVSIDYGLEQNIDRIVELIGRTNQLNFTKWRHPEIGSTQEFRRNFLDGEKGLFYQGGVVSVSDKYGDYGVCGFYLIGGREQDRKLFHYLFSCRILGMGVEHWLYNRLGRPTLIINGSVLSDPSEEREVDWIQLAQEGDLARECTSSINGSPNRSHVSIRLAGGCDLDPIAHYLRMQFSDVIGSTSRPRGGIFLRQDFSSMIINKHSKRGLHELRKIGFEESDLSSSVFRSEKRNLMIVTGLAADMGGQVVRHRDTGIEASMIVDGFPNFMSASEEETEKYISDYRDKIDPCLFRTLIAELRANWDDVGFGISSERFVENIAQIAASMPTDSCLVTVVPATRRYKDGEWTKIEYASRLKQALSLLYADQHIMHAIYIDDFIESPEDITNEWGTHYTRQVYFKIAKSLAEFASAMCLD